MHWNIERLQISVKKPVLHLNMNYSMMFRTQKVQWFNENGVARWISTCFILFCQMALVHAWLTNLEEIGINDRRILLSWSFESKLKYLRDWGFIAEIFHSSKVHQLAEFICVFACG